MCHCGALNSNIFSLIKFILRGIILFFNGQMPQKIGSDLTDKKNHLLPKKWTQNTFYVSTTTQICSKVEYEICYNCPRLEMKENCARITDSSSLSASSQNTPKHGTWPLDDETINQISIFTLSLVNHICMLVSHLDQKKVKTNYLFSHFQQKFFLPLGLLLKIIEQLT